MTHVGIERLSPSHAQHDRAQQDEGYVRRFKNKGQRIVRAEGLEDMRVINDVIHAQERDHDKPQQHDGAEKLAYASRAVLLNKEQSKQNSQRKRNDVFLQIG